MNYKQIIKDLKNVTQIHTSDFLTWQNEILKILIDIPEIHSKFKLHSDKTGDVFMSGNSEIITTHKNEALKIYNESIDYLQRLNGIQYKIMNWVKVGFTLSVLISSISLGINIYSTFFKVVSPQKTTKENTDTNSNTIQHNHNEIPVHNQISSSKRLGSGK